MVLPGEAPHNYVRLPRSELSTIHVVHVASEIDLSIGLLEGVVADPALDVITGVTEWAGEWQGVPLSVGWDWGVIAGEIIAFHPAGIRTNVRLVLDDGSLASAMLTRVYLVEWIENLPWRETAIAQLIPRTS